MKKILYRIFSVFLVIALLVSSISSTFAVGPVAEYVAGTFFDVIAGQLVSEGIDYIKDFIGYSAGKECDSSSDGYHHCEKAAFGHGTGGTDENGRYSLVSCKYCGETFKFYFSGGFGSGASGFGKSDLQQSYGSQVDELLAPIFTSAGAYSWKILPDKLYLIDGGFASGYKLNVLSDRISFSGTFNKLSQSYARILFCLKKPFYAPVDGIYSLSLCTISSRNIDNLDFSLQFSGTKGFYAGDVCLLQYAGESVRSNSVFGVQIKDFIATHKTLNYDSFPVSFEGYVLVTCVPGSPSHGDDYNITSRPTSITGDYGIIGDNGQIIKVEGDKIVNETNNTIYNPATGETKTMSDWSYNYEDRSYTVTTEAGDTVTITYGDENVTIVEGDATYNVYYLVNGSDSEDPGPDVPGTCNHQWTETSTTPATCTVPGSRTLTCSLCNETKTETIPAPGHKWTIKQEVKNEYDSSGNQTQEGYTIWECSVCGEQQRTTDGTAPPGGGGSGSGSSSGVFSGIFGLLVDFLGFFWNTFRDFVGEGVKGFLNALMDGTSSIFGLLNPFNWGG